jgi:hypothetical protein
MAIMIDDVIETPEGFSRIVEISRLTVNQFVGERIYFFENHVTARQKFNLGDGCFTEDMRFKPSEPASAWCNCQD